MFFFFSIYFFRTHTHASYRDFYMVGYIVRTELCDIRSNLFDICVLYMGVLYMRWFLQTFIYMITCFC